MSQSDIAISVRNLSKSYTISHQANGLRGRRPGFRETVSNFISDPFNRTPKETFWALNDVSFDVKKGDVVGIIGRNGAGKSTLLKILSRITKPTSGEIDVYGRIGSLLEVGTGFHPELTGRENIFLNGAILGMIRPEIRRQFDAIVDFAGVEQFLDTPVKRYSSGMYVRLAFAVAAHLNPEILIVDEVLSVGDAEFQKKCMGKMKDVSEQDGRAVLFVSHNLGAIQQLCNFALFLNRGKNAFFGNINDGVRSYMTAMPSDRPSGSNTDGLIYSVPVPRESQSFCISQIELINREGEAVNRVSTWDDFTLRIHIYAPRSEPKGSAYITIAGPDGTRMSMMATRPDCSFDFAFAEGMQVIDCAIRSIPLAAGVYTLSAGLAVPNVEFLWQGDSIAVLEVEQCDVFGSGMVPLYARSPVVINHEWRLAASKATNENRCNGCFLTLLGETCCL